MNLEFRGSLGCVCVWGGGWGGGPPGYGPGVCHWVGE